MRIFDARQHTVIAPHGMRGDLASTETMKHRPGERSCRLCHFLVKIGPDGGTVHWNKSDREKASLEDPWGAECARGVWSSGIAPELGQHLTTIVKKQRSKGECFFMPYTKGMSDSCAKNLERSHVRSCRDETKQSLHTDCAGDIGRRADRDDDKPAPGRNADHRRSNHRHRVQPRR